ncbi:hypothetical protein ABID39_001224 [Bartonella japonica]|uniref:Uncharacterized protein n=1 Tax=Bartonella japonica TaxID=357761 RepID=A0ABV2FPV6_9HYPH
MLVAFLSVILLVIFKIISLHVFKNAKIFLCCLPENEDKIFILHDF